MVRIISHGRLSILISLTIMTGSLLSAQTRVVFTATLQEWLYDRSGNLVLSQTGLHATRSDGSTARARNVMKPDKSGFLTQGFILDLTRAEEIALDALTESITTIPLRRDSVETYRRPARTCSDDDPIVRNNILGYEVVLDVEKIGSQAARTFRKEAWRAPALDCFPLKETLIIGRTEADSYHATVREVLQVTQGEPIAELFERPSGYVERSPSARAEEFQKRYPQAPCAECVKQTIQELDEIYYRRQADRGR